MKILLIHNFYQNEGGEDQAFHEEKTLLRAHGHKVIEYTLHNDSLKHKSVFHLAKITLWNSASYRQLTTLIKNERPHLAHFHNFFPLISPSGFFAVKAQGIPVIQTLHNFRLLCSNALFFRNGTKCEDCLTEKSFWPGIVHACYRESRLATCGVASMVGFHQWLSTWSTKIDSYIALSEFSRNKFIEGGISEQRIFVKPNFVNPDPGIGGHEGEFALFVGRLTPEKGLLTLLQAWGHFKAGIKLKIVGTGPLSNILQNTSKRDPRIEFLGHCSHVKVLDLMKEASVLIFPSLCFENMPMVIAEAFSTGLPVVGSDMGSTKGLIRHLETGLLYHPGDSSELASKLEWVVNNPHEISRLGKNARLEYQENFTSEKNYSRLMEIYEKTMSRVNQPVS